MPDMASNASSSCTSDGIGSISPDPGHEMPENSSEPSNTLAEPVRENGPKPFQNVGPNFPSAPSAGMLDTIDEEEIEEDVTSILPDLATCVIQESTGHSLIPPPPQEINSNSLTSINLHNSFINVSDHVLKGTSLTNQAVNSAISAEADTGTGEWRVVVGRKKRPATPAASPSVALTGSPRTSDDSDCAESESPAQKKPLSPFAKVFVPRAHHAAPNAAADQDLLAAHIRKAPRSSSGTPQSEQGLVRQPFSQPRAYEQHPPTVALEDTISHPTTSVIPIHHSAPCNLAPRVHALEDGEVLEESRIVSPGQGQFSRVHASYTEVTNGVAVETNLYEYPSGSDAEPSEQFHTEVVVSETKQRVQDRAEQWMQNCGERGWIAVEFELTDYHGHPIVAMRGPQDGCSGEYLRYHRVLLPPAVDGEAPLSDFSFDRVMRSDHEASSGTDSRDSSSDSDSTADGSSASSASHPSSDRSSSSSSAGESWSCADCRNQTCVTEHAILAHLNGKHATQEHTSRFRGMGMLRRFDQCKIPCSRWCPKGKLRDHQLSAACLCKMNNRENVIGRDANNRNNNNSNNNNNNNNNNNRNNNNNNNNNNNKNNNNNNTNSNNTSNNNNNNKNKQGDTRGGSHNSSSSGTGPRGSNSEAGDIVIPPFTAPHTAHSRSSLLSPASHSSHLQSQSARPGGYASSSSASAPAQLSARAQSRENAQQSSGSRTTTRPDLSFAAVVATPAGRPRGNATLAAASVAAREHLRGTMRHELDSTEEEGHSSRDHPSHSQSEFDRVDEQSQDDDRSNAPLSPNATSLTPRGNPKRDYPFALCCEVAGCSRPREQLFPDLKALTDHHNRCHPGIAIPDAQAGTMVKCLCGKAIGKFNGLLQHFQSSTCEAGKTLRANPDPSVYTRALEELSTRRPLPRAPVVSSQPPQSPARTPATASASSATAHSRAPPRLFAGVRAAAEASIRATSPEGRRSTSTAPLTSTTQRVTTRVTHSSSSSSSSAATVPAPVQPPHVRGNRGRQANAAEPRPSSLRVPDFADRNDDDDVDDVDPTDEVVNENVRNAARVFSAHELAETMQTITQGRACPSVFDFEAQKPGGAKLEVDFRAITVRLFQLKLDLLNRAEASPHDVRCFTLAFSELPTLLVCHPGSEKFRGPQIRSEVAALAALPNFLAQAVLRLASQRRAEWSEDAADAGPRRKGGAMGKGSGPAKRALNLLKTGCVSKCAKFLESTLDNTLISSSLTDDQRAKLQAKFPEASAADALEGDIPADLVPLTVSVEEMVKSFNALPQQSASGLSGWTFELMRRIASRSKKYVRQMVRFTNMLLANKLPQEAKRIIMTDLLIALEKDKFDDAGNIVKDVRPVCIAQCLLRLPCRTIARAVSPAAASLLVKQGQMGVGFPSGTEAAGHAVNWFLKTSSAAQHHEVRSVDLSNAFNEMRRGVIWKVLLSLKDVPEHATLYRLLPLFRCLYGDRTTLRSRDGVDLAVCGSGVRQGDPLAPLFFALGMYAVLVDFQSKCPAADKLAYLDDVNILATGADPESTSTTLDEAEEVFERSARDIAGLRLNRLKTKRLTIDSNGEVLGCPIGSITAVQETVAEGCDRAVRVIQVVHDLRLHQGIIPITQQSINFKVNHFSRTSLPESIRAPLQAFNDTILKQPLLAAGMPQQQVSELTSLLVTLPPEMGGLGIRNAAQVGPCAYVASLAVAFPLLRLAAPRVARTISAALDNLWLSQPPEGVMDPEGQSRAEARILWENTLKHFQALDNSQLVTKTVNYLGTDREVTCVAALQAIVLDDPVAERTFLRSLPAPFTQRSLTSKHVDAANRDRVDLLLRTAAVEGSETERWQARVHRATWKSYCEQGSTCIFQLSHREDRSLTNDQYRWNLRRRLLLPLIDGVPEDAVLSCGMCGHSSDSLNPAARLVVETHALTCRHNSILRLERHNAQKLRTADAFARLCGKAAVAVEVPLRSFCPLLRTEVIADGRVAIIGDGELVWDNAVVSVASKKALQLGTDEDVNRISEAKVREKENKYSEYFALINRDPSSLLALVTDDTGRLGPSSLQSLRRSGTAAAVAGRRASDNFEGWLRSLQTDLRFKAACGYAAMQARFTSFLRWRRQGDATLHGGEVGVELPVPVGLDEYEEEDGAPTQWAEDL